MVNLTGELVSPLIVIFVPLIVLLFAFRKQIPYGRVDHLIIGMLGGIGIEISLMAASSVSQSQTLGEFLAKLTAAFEGTVLYVFLVAIIGLVTLYPFFTKRRVHGVFSGIAASFTIFEVYFALRCYETIPFMETLGKHVC